MVNIQQPSDIYEVIDRPPENWSQLRELYEQALESFESGDFSSAAQVLGKLALDFPNDGPSVLLLSRVVNCLLAGDDGTFDPVWELSGK